MIRWRCVLAVLVAAACVRPAAAQVIGPNLARGGADIGIGVRFIERDLETRVVEQTYTPDFHVTGAFIRYGLRDWLTVSGEVAAANTHALEELLNENNVDGRYLLVGVGAQAAFAGGEGWALEAGFHVSRVGFLSREADRCHERDSEFLATVHARRTFSWGRQLVNVWGGPAYSPYSLQTYGGECLDTEWEATDDWGVVVGADGLWFGRARTFVHAVLIQHIQPRVGIALHFD